MGLNCLIALRSLQQFKIAYAFDRENQENQRRHKRGEKGSREILNSAPIRRRQFQEREIN
jgi:hypothetical protein